MCSLKVNKFSISILKTVGVNVLRNRTFWHSVVVSTEVTYKACPPFECPKITFILGTFVPC